MWFNEICVCNSLFGIWVWRKGWIRSTPPSDDYLWTYFNNIVCMYFFITTNLAKIKRHAQDCRKCLTVQICRYIKFRSDSLWNTRCCSVNFYEHLSHYLCWDNIKITDSQTVNQSQRVILSQQCSCLPHNDYLSQITSVQCINWALCVCTLSSVV